VREETPMLGSNTKKKPAAVSRLEAGKEDEGRPEKSKNRSVIAIVPET